MESNSEQEQVDAKTEALFLALGRGDVAAAATLIEQGADVNAKSSTGWTPLMFASLFGWVELAKMMLDRGADPNAETFGSNEISSTTVLLLAIGNSRVETIRLLLQRGVNVNATNSVGRTALSAARKHARAPSQKATMQEVIALLLAAGAEDISS
jgi:ankyrin repeat protein